MLVFGSPKEQQFLVYEQNRARREFLFGFFHGKLSIKYNRYGHHQKEEEQLLSGKKHYFEINKAGTLE